MIIPPTILLDRDGTINIDSGYISDPDTLELIPGVAQALAKLKVAGFRLVLVSNQSGIGRGMMTEADVQAVNTRLQTLLGTDSQLDRIFICPHHPEAACDCRKPKIGILSEFISEHSLDPSQTWMIGDKLSDIGLGQNLSIPNKNCFLVLTGSGQNEQKGLGSATEGPRVVASLVEATEIILSQFSA